MCEVIAIFVDVSGILKVESMLRMPAGIKLVIAIRHLRNLCEPGNLVGRNFGNRLSRRQTCLVADAQWQSAGVDEPRPEGAWHVCRAPRGQLAHLIQPQIRVVVADASGGEILHLTAILLSAGVRFAHLSAVFGQLVKFSSSIAP